MSRLGKKPIKIPSQVEVKIEGNKVTVKGPKGELSRKIRPEIEVKRDEGNLVVFPKKETKNSKAFWGLTRALLDNMVTGVCQGYEKKLEIQGLGYKANMEGDTLVLMTGFTHPVKITPPQSIKISTQQKIITVSGIDKELVGQIASKIKKVRPAEPYKGKGIRYVGEVIRRKAGKKAATTVGQP